MIEIVIPARNPGEVFTATIDSLLAQTDRQFSVLLSDNYSTQGLERIEEAAQRLSQAGIPVRTIRPPWELGRVQHWNWVHHQSAADWLKPLFVGDWLEPDCLASCRAVIAADPELRFIFWYFRYHRGEESYVCDCGQLAGRLDPKPLGRKAIFKGNFVGGPINVLYRRDAFEALGGYYTSLPLMADFDLYTRLAIQVPSHAIPRILGHFQLHENRFARKGSGLQRESMNAEWVLEAATIAYSSFTMGNPIPLRVLLPRMLRLLAAWLREWLFHTGGNIRRRMGESTGD